MCIRPQNNDLQPSLLEITKMDTLTADSIIRLLREMREREEEKIMDDMDYFRTYMQRPFAERFIDTIKDLFLKNKISWRTKINKLNKRC